MPREIKCHVCGIYSADISTHRCQAVQALNAHPAPPAMMPAAAVAKRLAHYFQQNTPMDTDPDAALVPAADRKKWDTALANFIYYSSGDDKREFFIRPAATIGSLTLGTFAALRSYERNAVITRMWNAIVIWVKGNKRATEMFDALANDQVHFTSSASNRVSMAFQKFGIGFRCEKDEDLSRILVQPGNGFQPLYRNGIFAQSIGHHICGTAMESRTRDGEMALWRKNQDAVGQTAICISRNLRGATKYPEKTYDGRVIVFAVKPSGVGFDTERWQQAQGNKAVWRPGEKMFPLIPKDDIIAYTPVLKTATRSEQHNWGFQFLRDKWIYLDGKGNPQERAYLDGELAAIRALGDGTVWVPKSDDFYQN